MQISSLHFVCWALTVSLAASAGCLLDRRTASQRSAGIWTKHGLPSAIPSTYLAAETMPTAFDWRNHNGQCYTTRILNQHMPLYCGSCWLHAATSVLSDRIRIASLRRGATPEIVLARQVVLNCGEADPEVEAGNCSGGSAAGYFNWTAKHGLPDDSCQEYDATDHECSDYRTCMNCGKIVKPDGSWISSCYPVERYAKWFVEEWGTMKNPTPFEIKSEVHERGPIACMVDSSFIENGNYVPGTMVTDVGKKWNFDHEIAIVGWGVEDNKEYWIVRNSWGTFWGDDGFFRVQAGVNAIGIETECTWAVPSDRKVESWGPKEGKRMFPSVVEPDNSGYALGAPDLRSTSGLLVVACVSGVLASALAGFWIGLRRSGDVRRLGDASQQLLQ